MQGTVSPAAALALPSTTTRGGAFPQRTLTMSLTLAVIFATFTGDRLALPPLIRHPDLGEGGTDAGEETRARPAAAKTALCQTGSLAPGDRADEQAAERLRPCCRFRGCRLAARTGQADDEG